MPNTVNIHSIAIGPEELKQPISDYELDQVLGGTLIPNQATAKALARQVKELRQQLSITVSAHGEVKRGILQGGRGTGTRDAP